MSKSMKCFIVGVSGQETTEHGQHSLVSEVASALKDTEFSIEGSSNLPKSEEDWKKLNLKIKKFVKGKKLLSLQSYFFPRETKLVLVELPLCDGKSDVSAWLKVFSRFVNARRSGERVLLVATTSEEHVLGSNEEVLRVFDAVVDFSSFRRKQLALANLRSIRKTFLGGIREQLRTTWLGNFRQIQAIFVAGVLLPLGVGFFSKLGELSYPLVEQSAKSVAKWFVELPFLWQVLGVVTAVLIGWIEIRWILVAVFTLNNSTHQDDEE